jgi:hypothetical protein
LKTVVEECADKVLSNDSSNIGAANPGRIGTAGDERIMRFGSE